MPAMSDGGDEVVLVGGNLTRVVRSGDTVRREAGPWTPMVHDLLRHVRGAGFALAPEPLGLDEAGREVLRYLPGDTMVDHPWPGWVWDDALLVEAAGALADYHRAVADFRPAAVASRLGTTELGVKDIVCHNDFTPYNCAFRDGRLVGVFDWDVVVAAPPIWDVATFAWQWVPLHAPSGELAWRTAETCARRIRLVVDGYGRIGSGVDLVHHVLDRIESSRSGILDRAAGGDEVFRRLERGGHAADMARSIDFVRSIEGTLRRALSQS